MVAVISMVRLQCRAAEGWCLRLQLSLAICHLLLLKLFRAEPALHQSGLWILKALQVDGVVCGAFYSEMTALKQC